MSDDSLLWTHKPAPRCRPRPGEALWSAQQGDVTWSAELRFHGEYGVEAQILRNGELTVGRRFLLKVSAIAWTKAEKVTLRPPRANETAYDNRGGRSDRQKQRNRQPHSQLRAVSLTSVENEGEQNRRAHRDGNSVPCDRESHRP